MTLINATIQTTLPVRFRTVLPTTVDTSTVNQSSSFAGSVTIGVNQNYTYEFFEAGSANRKTVSIPSNATSPYAIDLSVVGSVTAYTNIIAIAAGGTNANNSSSAAKNLLPPYLPNRYLYTDGNNIFWSSTAATGGGGGGSVTDPLVLGTITIDGTGNGSIAAAAGGAVHFDSGGGVDVVGDLSGGNLSYPIKMMTWPGQAGSWLDMGGFGACGIGTGGQGSNLWIGLADANGNWFGDAVHGDICYRNTVGNILIGTYYNSGGVSNIRIDTNGTVFLQGGGKTGISVSDGGGATADTTFTSQTIYMPNLPGSNPGPGILWVDPTTRVLKVGT